jgi:ABC-type multidrug transport system ATPase subunit/pSer/pThr/pTyr-binding forkhead associated (FHA) protein
MTEKKDTTNDLASPGAPTEFVRRSSRVIVCPACHYGLLDPGSADGTYACPRPECGHCWEALSKTLQQIHLPDRRRALPEIRVVTGAPPAFLELPAGEALIGRDPSCQLVLDNLNVSRQHARLLRQDEYVWIEDLESQWGVRVNGRLIQERTQLWPGDELVIGGARLHYAVRFEAMTPKQDVVDNTAWIGHAEKSAPTLRGNAAEIIKLEGKRLTFGRAPNRDVVLPDSMISRRQAVLDYDNGTYYLSDVQSQIGTYVNGKSIIRVKLEKGDRIQLGPYLYRFDGDALTRIRQPATLDVVALGLSKSVGAVQVLDDVSLVLQHGEFVGLLGPSGAGKTTLLDALNGFRPARTGQVLINGDSLYAQYERLRHLIGYVPQNDHIHKELTPRQALYYAARLRLPAEASDDELNRLVDETLTTLDLADRADVPIGQLSGGQRKRANVGVELLSKPGILFLDEPTAGLDPSTESRLMRKFKQLASQGRTVVCTTHVMENVDLFDKVAILAPGGRLAYFGPPGAAKAYFGIEKFTLLYERLEEKSAEDWKQDYRNSTLCAEYLARAAGDRATSTSERRRTAAPAPPSSSLGQLKTLLRRFTAILGADKQHLAVLAAQPLVIAALICLVCRGLPLTLFLVAIAALWFGCSMGAQQIVRERAIYRRERMVNLRLDCYILSKFLPLAVLSAVQCLLMLLIVWPWRGHDGSLLVQFGALVLTGWSGVAMGLIISARAANADKATSIVPLTVLPQIILAGALMPLPDMDAGTRALSNLMVSRWANQALEIGLLQGSDLTPDLVNNEHYFKALWNLYPEYKLKDIKGRQQLLDEHKTVDRSRELAVAATVLLLFVAIQLLIVAVILRRQDAF